MTDAATDRATLYDRLKERLVLRFAATKWNLAFQILGHPGLGDQCPTQLLDVMMALLPPGEPAPLKEYISLLERTAPPPFVFH